MREKSARDKGGIDDVGKLLAMIVVIARNSKVAGFHLILILNDRFSLSFDRV